MKILSFFLVLICLPAISASDKEKRTFLENLAEVSRKKKVFYRWQSERSAQTLLDAKKMTLKLYNYYMSKNDPWAGAGLYVSENITSSARHGRDIIQVDLAPGHKYLNLLDPDIRQELKTAGISIEDVYRLNPRVAITDIKEGKPYWVLKGQKGITFKNFNPHNIHIDDLTNIYQMGKSPHVNRAIANEVLRRAEQNLASVVTGDFIDILKNKHGSYAVQEAVSLRIQSLKSMDESMKLLQYANDYVDMDELIRKSLPLIKTSQHGINFLFKVNDHIKPTLRNEIIKKSITLMITPEDGVEIMQKAHKYINRDTIKEIANQMLGLDFDEIRGKERIQLILNKQEYQEVTTKFEANKKARLDCLKNQLSVMTEFWTDYE